MAAKLLIFGLLFATVLVLVRSEHEDDRRGKTVESIEKAPVGKHYYHNKCRFTICGPRAVCKEGICLWKCTNYGYGYNTCVDPKYGCRGGVCRQQCSENDQCSLFGSGQCLYGLCYYFPANSQH